SDPDEGLLLAVRRLQQFGGAEGAATDRRRATYGRVPDVGEGVASARAEGPGVRGPEVCRAGQDAAIASRRLSAGGAQGGAAAGRGSLRSAEPRRSQSGDRTPLERILSPDAQAASSDFRGLARVRRAAAEGVQGEGEAAGGKASRQRGCQGATQSARC